MVSKEMIDAAVFELDDRWCLFDPRDMPGGGKPYLSLLARYSINAALKAAWKPFNKDDPGTWPKTEYAPSGHTWAIQFSDGFEHIRFDQPVWEKWEVTRYCDPADILPPMEKEDA